MFKKIIASFLILSCSIAVGTPAIAATSQRTINTTRLSGQSQYETAKAISESYNQGEVRNVILSTGNGFADALSASVLAHQKDAPILLVDTSVDGSKDAFDYITQHLDPKGTVYIIGGTGIINKEFEGKLNTLGFNNIVRVAGNDRYDTSYQLAQSLNYSAVSTVVIASGESYPDALSIASFAANKGWPILLTPQASLPQEMKEYLSDKKPSKVYITGGTGVISDNVKTEIGNILQQASIERLAGQDRFDSNATIVQTFAPNPSTVYLATGYGFADALAGSTLAAKNGDPIIFIDPSVPTLPKSVASYFAKLYSSNINIIVFGGSGVVTDEVLKNSSDLISGVVKEDSIYSIGDITATVRQNQAYSLPITVSAKLYNSDTIDVPVKWDQSSVDTSTIGSTVCNGFVDGYSKTIRLTLNIISTLLESKLQNLLTSIPQFVKPLNSNNEYIYQFTKYHWLFIDVLSPSHIQIRLSKSNISDEDQVIYERSLEVLKTLLGDNGQEVMDKAWNLISKPNYAECQNHENMNIHFLTIGLLACGIDIYDTSNVSSYLADIVSRDPEFKVISNDWIEYGKLYTGYEGENKGASDNSIMVTRKEPSLYNIYIYMPTFEAHSYYDLQEALTSFIGSNAAADLRYKLENTVYIKEIKEVYDNVEITGGKDKGQIQLNIKVANE